MFDFIIFCIGSTIFEPVLPGNDYFFLSEESGVHDENSSSTDWDIIYQSKGTLYTLLANSDEINGRLNIAVSDINAKHEIVYPWMNDVEQQETYCLRFPSESYVSVEKILRYLQDASPVHRLYVLVRCQSISVSHIVGTLTISEFMERFKTGKIQTNICYILSDKGRYNDKALSLPMFETSDS